MSRTGQIVSGARRNGRSKMPSSGLLAPADVGVTFVPRLRDEAVLVEVADEGVLYDERTGALHQLNPSATLLCGMFDGRTSLGDIVERLSATFRADRRMIEADVLAMTRELGALGVLAGVAGESSEREADDAGR